MRLKFRPDILVIENLDATDHRIHSLQRTTDPVARARLCRNSHFKIHIVELGYTSSSRYLEKLEEKRTQHERLRVALHEAGWPFVTITPLVLSTCGQVPVEVITWMQTLHVPPAQITATAHKLNALAVRKGQAPHHYLASHP
jgi:hypothetical protein